MTDREKIHELCEEKKNITMLLQDEQARCNKLLRENLELKTRIEKMKCCGNCKHNGIEDDIEFCWNCERKNANQNEEIIRDEWELYE